MHRRVFPCAYGIPLDRQKEVRITEDIHTYICTCTCIVRSINKHTLLHGTCIYVTKSKVTRSKVPVYLYISAALLIAIVFQCSKLDMDLMPAWELLGQESWTPRSYITMSTTFMWHLHKPNAFLCTDGEIPTYYMYLYHHIRAGARLLQPIISMRQLQ